MKQRIIIVFLLCLTVLVVAENANTYQRRQADAIARGELERIRDLLYHPTLAGRTVAVFNSEGELVLPPPLQRITLQSGAVVPYFFKIARGKSEILLVAVQAVGGSKLYRWSDLYGERRFQSIQLSSGASNG